ncbi:BRO-N domain-containing protein [Alicyclobacillus fastidiosus]|uniref:BRO family protein n=1 Tax=Alicyclobacillus fastidiosus TaxID=392011 RepID=A0ABV5AKI4_9BACL|nr:BRO family protein [Alicyclobacillus fastidiosus]WEH08213.1 BRO family protein [Alicyclobacillus fastidiosus]
MPLNVRIEVWNGHEIRFVEKEPGDWWAVLADVATALHLHTRKVGQRLPDDVLSKYPILDALGRTQEMLIVSRYGIYEAVFESRKREAREFRRWVFEILEALRESSGLEGFQVFRMLDKDHQKEAMARLKASLQQPVRVDFIKANTIANKAVSTLYGHPKMLKKDAMSPAMLVKREEVLDDTVELMGTAQKFGLSLSVSEAIYAKHIH